jgi:hypothetical protein
MCAEKQRPPSAGLHISKSFFGSFFTTVRLKTEQIQLAIGASHFQRRIFQSEC